MYVTIRCLRVIVQVHCMIALCTWLGFGFGFGFGFWDFMVPEMNYSNEREFDAIKLATDNSYSIKLGLVLHMNLTVS